MSPVFAMHVCNVLFGASGCWFVNCDIDDDDIINLLKNKINLEREKRILKEIHSSSVDQNSSMGHLNYKSQHKR